MKLFQEFKDFAVKGNMIEIAIGVIIGAAFNKVVDVIVKEVLMPPLSLLTGGLNFENKKLVLREATIGVDGDKYINIEEVAIGYGKLIETGIDFMIIGFTVFLIVKGMNSLKKKAQNPQDKTVTTPKDIELLSKMNELLAEQNRILEERLKH